MQVGEDLLAQQGIAVRQRRTRVNWVFSVQGWPSKLAPLNKPEKDLIPS